MNFTDIRPIIKTVYEKNCFGDKFEVESDYLETAFNDVDKLWRDNFDEIEKVKYLMIAEAPLWGKEEKYIYNLNYKKPSQFFYPSDLGFVLNRNIQSKKELIAVFNEIGLVIIDISPFPLNQFDTSINYRKLSKNEYRELIRDIIPIYFEEKLNLIAEKKSSDIIVFFRYNRVKNTFQDLISNVLIANNFIKHQNDIGEIAKQGGGIDRKKLGQIITERDL